MPTDDPDTIEAQIDGDSSYLRDITATTTAYYDESRRGWVDRQGRPTTVPLPSQLRIAAADKVLAELLSMVPSVSALLAGLQQQVLDKFVESVLDRVKEDAPLEIAQAGRTLMRAVISEKTRAAKSNNSSGWSLESKATEILTYVLENVMRQELEKQLAVQHGLIERIVTDALKRENLTATANNLITPKLVELVKELRLELTAGSKSRY